MNVLMKLATTSNNLSDPPATIQLTAQKADENWRTQDNITITVTLSGKNIRNTYSVKQACSLLDIFIKPSDRLCWLSQKELDLFLQFFKQYMTFRIAKNSIVFPPGLPNITESITPCANADLREIAEQLEKAAEDLIHLKSIQ